MNTPTEKPKFKSFIAKHRNGQSILVINRLSNGTGFKVRNRWIAGYNGWSGGSWPVYAHGSPYWIKAENLVIKVNR